MLKKAITLQEVKRKTYGNTLDDLEVEAVVDRLQLQVETVDNTLGDLEAAEKQFDTVAEKLDR